MLARTDTTKRITSGLVAILVCGLYVTTAHSGEPEITSQWNSDSVVIDGAESEWAQAKIHLDDTKVGIAVRNDDEFIYVHLATTDETAIRQIMGLGLIIWFDPDGGDDKEFGVRYPVGLVGSGSLRRFTGKRPDRNDLTVLSDSLAPGMELLDEQGEVIQRIQTGARADISAQLMIENRRLVYELKVPLFYSEEHLYAIGTNPGGDIGIGFETPKPEFDREPLVKTREGMRGRDGRFGGAGGFGRRGRNRPERPEPLNQWTKVELAVEPMSELN